MNDVMVKCLFEFIGTIVLVLFGDGVVASTVLKKSKGENGGWVVITLAWGLAVMLGVFISGPYSGAHLNPAVTLGLAAAGTFPLPNSRPSVRFRPSATTAATSSVRSSARLCWYS